MGPATGAARPRGWPRTIDDPYDGLAYVYVGPRGCAIIGNRSGLWCVNDLRSPSRGSTSLSCIIP